MRTGCDRFSVMSQKNNRMERFNKEFIFRPLYWVVLRGQWCAYYFHWYPKTSCEQAAPDSLFSIGDKWYERTDVMCLNLLKLFRFVATFRHFVSSAKIQIDLLSNLVLCSSMGFFLSTLHGPSQLRYKFLRDGLKSHYGDIVWKMAEVAESDRRTSFLQNRVSLFSDAI